MAPVLSKMQTMDKLRIAIVAPLYYTVPPFKYGGTERVVAFLIEELVALGHSVTLYGAEGCKTEAELVRCSPMTFHDAGVAGTIPEMKFPYVLQLRRLLADLTSYDVVNIHHGIFPFHADIFTKPGPFVWTDHCELHTEGKGDTLDKLYQNANAGATSISESQRDILTGERYWLKTIYHGLPKYLLAPITAIEPTYLAFLGRLAPEKGAPDAVRISALAGMHLKVAAKMEDIHAEYCKREVLPMFAKHEVEYIGEITDEGKSPFLSGAVALIFPIQWKEPFGLVMIEAMACGTPVIAYNNGAVPEVVEHGVTGFIVNSIEEAAAKVKDAAKLDRVRIRGEFEKRWTAKTMAKEYEELFYRIRDGKAWDPATATNDDPVASSDNDVDDGDNDEHVCPGHYHCAVARAEKRLDRVGSSDSGPVTHAAVDDLAAGLAKLRAGRASAAK
jgi:glycosyltransferase involved in cell wall biosynthesis